MVAPPLNMFRPFSLVLLTVSALAFGQAAPAKSWVVPRAPDGEPDFSGVWLANFTYNGRRVVDLNLGLGIDIPYQAWSKQKFEENSSPRGRFADPEANCLPAGVPRITGIPYPQRFMQTPGLIAILYEGNVHTYRLIHTDRSTHPKDLNPTWMGDSIGHWEGDTLVVDTVGFNDRTWLDTAGHVHTDALHVVERYTRTDPDTILYQFTIDDPKAYTKPWSQSYPLKRHEGWELIEYVCNENNKDVEHLKNGNP